MKHNLAYYRKIQGTYGVQTAKEAQLRAARGALRQSFQKTLNWETVYVNKDEEMDFLIVPTDDLYTKKIKTHPDGCLRLGDIISWADTFWIVNSLDADSQITHQGTMVQCNICLRWQLEDLSIHEEYGWDKDASKYSYGETRTPYMDTPQFTMKAIFQINEYTLSIRRNKRFLLGLYADGQNPLAVEVSRINGITNLYQYEDNSQHENSGLLEITMHETQFNPEKDNIMLGVADYMDTYVSEDKDLLVPADREVPNPGMDPVNNESGEWF